MARAKKRPVGRPPKQNGDRRVKKKPTASPGVNPGQLTGVQPYHILQAIQHHLQASAPTPSAPTPSPSTPSPSTTPDPSTAPTPSPSGASATRAPQPPSPGIEQQFTQAEAVAEVFQDVVRTGRLAPSRT